MTRTGDARARRLRSGVSGSKGRSPSAGGVRLQRVLADAGVAARRACEALIERGRVAVNGRVVRSLPAFVDPRRDRVTVDGKPVVRPSRRVLVMLNKPARVLCANADEPGAARRTVAGLVRHPSGARLFPVGRLEYEATGLVLMTNDGGLAQRLAHPRFAVSKVYRAVVRGEVSDAVLPRLERDIAKVQRRLSRRAGRVRSSRVRLHVEQRGEGRTVLRLTLAEGRVPSAARVLAAAGFPVRNLEQIALGPLRLRGVARGRWRELERDEVQSLRALVRSNGGAGAPAAPAEASG